MGDHYDRSKLRHFIEQGGNGIEYADSDIKFNKYTVLSYMREIYPISKKITQTEYDKGRCKHQFYNDDGTCKECKRNLTEILREEAIFYTFIDKRLSKDKVMMIGNILEDNTLYIRFEAFMDKFK